MNITEFEILRKIYNKSASSQRKLSKELDTSLGKVNYCLNALIHKGYVKITNFFSKSEIVVLKKLVDDIQELKPVKGKCMMYIDKVNKRPA